MRTLYTRQELAEHLSITARSVDNMRKRGMPTIQVNRSNAVKFGVEASWIPILGSIPMFDVKAVQAWIESKRNESSK